MMKRVGKGLHFREKNTLLYNFIIIASGSSYHALSSVGS